MVCKRRNNVYAPKNRASETSNVSEFLKKHFCSPETNFVALKMFPKGWKRVDV